MKHIVRKLTAITAAAITAVSAAGMTASAYSVADNYAYTHLTWGGGSTYSPYANSTVAEQNAHPCFKIALWAQTNHIASKFKKAYTWGDHQSIFANLDTYFNRYELEGTNQQNSENFTIVRRFADKISVQEQSGKYYPCVLSYRYYLQGNNLSKYSLEFWDVNKLNTEVFINSEETVLSSYNRETGEYSGYLDFDTTYYPVGLQASCSDGLTVFDEPVIYKVNKYNSKVSFKIPFHGKVKYPDNNDVYFRTGESNSGYYSILTNLKFTYNHGTLSYNMNSEPITLSKATINSLYYGIMDSTSVTTHARNYYGGQYATHFKQNRFEAVKVNGSTLQIFIGKGLNNELSASGWNNAYGETKLRAFLSMGYRTAFDYNTWLQNKLSSSSITKVQFFWNSTTTSIGNSFYECTPAKLSSMLRYN